MIKRDTFFLHLVKTSDKFSVEATVSMIIDILAQINYVL